MMNEQQFKARTKRFALAVMALVAELPRTPVAQAIGGQRVRAGTSVGANYRAACRARSRADMIAKLSIVEEEADESLYWFELLEEGRIVSTTALAALNQEGHEILAITVASLKTLRANR